MSKNTSVSAKERARAVAALCEHHAGDDDAGPHDDQEWHIHSVEVDLVLAALSITVRE